MKSDTSKKTSDTSVKEISEEQLLQDLQSAYKATTEMQNTPSHKKIFLDLERKIRNSKKSKKNVSE